MNVKCILECRLHKTLKCSFLTLIEQEESAAYCRTPYPGGAPANVAAALGRLGIKVAFVSALGNDYLAKQMLDLLRGAPHVAPNA